MLALSLSPEYILRAREINDVALFVFLALAAIALYLRTGSQPGRAGALLAVCTGLMLLSSYSAVFVAGAMLAHAATDKGRRERLLVPLLAGLVAGAPLAVRMLLSMPEEIRSRAMASSFASHVWGGQGLPEFVVLTARTIIADSWLVPVSVLCAASLALGWRRLRDEGLVAWMLLLNLLFPLMSVFFRMKPYYAMFLLPAMLMACAVAGGGRAGGSATFRDYLRSVVPLAAIAVIAISLCMDLQRSRESIYVQESNYQDWIAVPAHGIKSQGGKVVVIDVSHDLLPLVYNLFAAPYGSMAARGTNRVALRCDGSIGAAECIADAGSGLVVYALTGGNSLKPGWEDRSAASLDRLMAREPLHFVYNRQLPNERIFRRLSERCTVKLEGKKYILFGCGK
jgi:hypothetical protein